MNDTDITFLVVMMTIMMCAPFLIIIMICLVLVYRYYMQRSPDIELD